MYKRRLTILFLPLFLYSVNALAADTINGEGADVVVDNSAPDGGDGQSFVTAYNNLQVALAAATDQDGDGDIEVWIAEGVYVPHASDRDVSFDLQDGMKLIGGWRGAYGSDGNSGLKRNPNLYQTILSGELQNDGNNNNNSKHVLTVTDKTGVVLYGLTIEEGSDDSPFVTVGDGISLPFVQQGYGRGGGLLALGTDITKTEVTIIASVFRGNSAAGAGGAIYGDHVNISVEGSNFDDNNATEGYGGAIMLDSFSDLKITNSVFTNNSALGGIESSGGAIYVAPVWLSLLDGRLDYSNPPADPTSLATTATVTISDSTFINNLSDFGGAVEIDGGLVRNFPPPSEDDYGRTVGTIERSHFESNEALFASAMYLGFGSQIYVDRSTFLENLGTRTINTQSGAGLIVSNSDFSGNQGGALRITGAAISGEPHKIVDSTFTNNSIVGPGGAIESVTPDTQIIDSTFTGNSASNGGAIFTGFIGSTTTTIEGSTFEGNSARNGGAIFNYRRGSVIIDQSQFRNNFASNVAGAIFHQDGDMLITKSHLESNSSDNVGGAIYTRTTLGLSFNLSILSSHFHRNSTLRNVGGGIYAQNIDLSVAGNVFVNNTAAGTGDGDALFWQDTTGGDFADFIDHGKNKFAGGNTLLILSD
jgi:predicted outer membrane repeat protein